MLMLGIILLILGLAIFKWVANTQKKPFSERPMILNNNMVFLSVNLFWLALVVGGLYSLWKVNSLVVLAFLSACVFLCIVNYFLQCERNKAKKIFNTYKQLKLFRPKTKEHEIFKETIRIYFSNLQWDEQKTEAAVYLIFENIYSSEERKDIKDIANFILAIENPSNNFGLDFNFGRNMKRHTEKQKAIDKAYDDVFGKAKKNIERPTLSKNIQDWIKETGLNPEEMSNEQLATFAEIDDVNKSNWLIRFLYGISFVFLILTGFNLLILNLGGVLLNSIISFAIWFVGHKMQMKRISRKFYEASIIQYVEEQEKNKNN